MNYMLEMKKITIADKILLQQVTELYENSFPENERKDLRNLLKENQEIGEIYVFTEKETFIGFVCLLNCLDISHIIYFAISPELRGKGYGSTIVKKICEYKKDYRIIIDIEIETPVANNNEQRRKRKQFYLRNGFADTLIKYTWRQDDFEIMSYGGTITEEEFFDFWDTIDSIDDNLNY